ncbi:MAG: hypothetical protein HYY41_02840 [Chloroflexi bacterium]|nr:hypothetical protein [Chloroflexota bacterium]
MVDSDIILFGFGCVVILAKARIQVSPFPWIPAYAGMTSLNKPFISIA